jgi:hypothetical protein
MQGSKGAIDVWGHEYMRHLAGEISEEYRIRREAEADTEVSTSAPPSKQTHTATQEHTHTHTHAHTHTHVTHAQVQQTYLGEEPDVIGCSQTNCE